MTLRTNVTTMILICVVTTIIPPIVARAAALQRDRIQRATNSTQAKVDRSASTTQPTALSADELFRNTSPAVVSVEILDTNFKLVGQGSGFFVSNDGMIATNHHVIADAQFAIVKVPNGNIYQVEGIVGVDLIADLALLKVNTEGHPFLKLAEPAVQKIGIQVYTIGNPQGLSNTLSEGLISGHRRLIDIRSNKPANKQDGPDYANGEEVTLIQTTAPISPGSSGGPLLSINGSVIGVVTSYLAGGQNLNFAVPVRHLITLIRTRGEVKPLASAGGKPLDRNEVDKLQPVWGAIEKEDYGNALRLLAALREQQDGSAPYWFTTGVVHYNLGNHELAADAYLSAIRLAPKNSSYHYALGWAYIRLHKDEAALDAFMNTVRLDPTNSQAFYHIGVVYRVLGDNISWEGQHRDAKQYYTKAVSAMKTVIALEPSHTSAYFELTGLYSSLGSKAEWLARPALEAGDFDMWHKKIQPFIDSTNIISLYKSVLAIEPENADAYRHLAAMYRGQARDTTISLMCRKGGFFDECIEAGLIGAPSDASYREVRTILIQRSISSYKSAIAIETKDAETFINLVQSYEVLFDIDGLRRAKEAIEAIESALVIDSDDGFTYYLLGSIYEDLRQYDAAKTAFEAALAIKPDPYTQKKFDLLSKCRDHDLHFSVPDTWIPLPAQFETFIELAKYRLPIANGDTEDVELILRHVNPHDVLSDELFLSDYLAKWAHAFGVDPKRTKVAILNTDKLKISHFLLKGSFYGVSRRTGWQKDNYGMLAAYIEGPGGPWTFRALGPQATIDAAWDDFLQMLRSVRR